MAACAQVPLRLSLPAQLFIKGHDPMINVTDCWLLMPQLMNFTQYVTALPAYLSPVHSTMRLGFQQRLTTLFPASFGLETNSALAPLHY